MRWFSKNSLAFQLGLQLLSLLNEKMLEIMNICGNFLFVWKINFHLINLMVTNLNRNRVLYLLEKINLGLRLSRSGALNTMLYEAQMAVHYTHCSMSKEKCIC